MIRSDLAFLHQLCIFHSNHSAADLSTYLSKDVGTESVVAVTVTTTTDYTTTVVV